MDMLWNGSEDCRSRVSVTGRQWEGSREAGTFH